MIVVDLGCADRDEWRSLESLATVYEPDVIYGFDPSPSLNVHRKKVCGVPVRLARKAAWLYDGTVSFEDKLISGRDGPIGYAPDTDRSLGRIGTIGEGDTTVPCFDFSAWLAEHGPAIVKMDIEGAEYELLGKLVADKTIRLVTQLIVEWHDEEDPKLTRLLGCPVVTWWM